MNKIYTLLENSKRNWKADILYPVSVFSVACMILVLSSFSTKSNLESNPNQQNWDTELNPTENYEDSNFRIESIGGGYRMIKAEAAGLDLIMRKDRIEVYSETTEGRFTYFVFTGSNMSELPIGKNLVSTFEEVVTNQAMSSTLGSDKMNVEIFKNIVYENLYPGVDLILSIKDSNLKLDLISDSPKLAQKFNMELIGLAPKNTLKSNGSLDFARNANSINIASTGDTKITNDKGFIKLDKASTTNQDITINISFK